MELKQFECICNYGKKNLKYHRLIIMSQKSKELKDLMEELEEGYAYQIMALQMEVENRGTDNSKIESISRLLQLYMMGVEILESKGDPRYKYFSLKIQNLMKKPVILQQMHRASSTLLSQETSQDVIKAQLGERKQDYRVQMFLIHEMVNQKKVKQIVDTAENKLKKLESHVQGSMISQDKQLAERIRRRKLRSEAGSIQKFKVTKGQIINYNLVNQKMQDFLEPMDSKLRKHRLKMDLDLQNRRQN